jgi:hypothetical protein
MKNSDSRYWLIPLLAAFAIYVPLSSAPPSPDQQPSAQPQFPALVQLVPLPTPTPTPAPAPAQDRAPGEAAKLLCDYFGSKQNLDQDAQGRTGPQDFDPKNLRGDYCRVKSIKELNRGGQPAPDKQGSDKYDIEYMIATLPDPKDSRFDHLFDRYQDAIQRAIGRAGYIFDRYWLPWDRSRTAAPVVSPTDPRAPQMAMATRHLYEPGVILFRHIKDGTSSNDGTSSKDGTSSNDGTSSKDSNRLLLLFLVGETPTSGIHKVAFRNALWQIEKIAGWEESKTEKEESKAEKKELRILSPCFSGSDASLATLLKAWIDEHKNLAGLEVRIFSGSAITVREDLLEEIAPGKVSFQATVIHNERAMDKFYEYLEDRDSWSNRNDSGPRVAWLSEAVTASGQRVSKKERKAVPTLSLTFPLHISQLRIEAAKINLQRDEAAKAKAITAKAPDIALPMREAGSPTSKDIVPLFSQVETVTMDLTLDEALSAIRRERIRYVGVTATDVQDRIFLVREIRKQCPNVTIVIYGTDLLYLHSESYLDFQGALIISPYPLFGLNQLWTYPFDGYERRLQFSTQSAQGLYNATLALLGKTDRMLEYGCPLKEYKKGNNRYPALWLGIVGRNGIWPVTAFDVFDSKNPTEKASYTLPVLYKSASSGLGKNPKLGLSGNYWSPTGLGILLLIAVICLFLSLVCLTQLAIFWGRGRDPNQWRERRFSPGRRIIELSQELEREIKERKVRLCLRPFAWIRRGWLGRVFGAEQIYRYPRDRRTYLMCCSFSLVAITLFISSVAMLPAWIRYEMAKGEKWYPSLFVIADMILVLALARICWLAASITRRHLRWPLVAWLALGLVAAMIACIIRRDQDLWLGVIAVMIFGFAWVVLCWLVCRPAVRFIEWGFHEFKREWFRHRNPDAPAEMASPADYPPDLASRIFRYFRDRFEAVVALGVGAAMVTFVVLGLIEIFHAKTPEQIPEQVFFFLRATELASGVSVLLPALLIGLAAFLSFFASLRRLNLAERMPCLPKSQECPDDAKPFLHFDHVETKSFKGLKVLENRVKEMIVCSNAPRELSAVFVISILYWLLYLRNFIPSVDGRWFDCFFKLGFFVAPLLLTLAFLRFVRAVGSAQEVVATFVMASADFTIRRRAFRGETIRIATTG